MTRPNARSACLALTVGATLLATAGLAPASGVPPVVGAAGAAPVSAARAAVEPLVDGPYTQRFLELYADLHDPANGYFTPQGIPYHSVETLIVEAPDHGHETTSEAYSYWLWLEAMYGRVTGDWAAVQRRLGDHGEVHDPHRRPTSPPTPSTTPPSPATYAPGVATPRTATRRRSTRQSSVGTRPDRRRAEVGVRHRRRLRHALARSTSTTCTATAPCREPAARTGRPPPDRPTSTPSSAGRRSRSGRPSRSRRATSSSTAAATATWTSSPATRSYAKQWKYTDAPDADARAVQAAYWANVWASEQGNGGDVAATRGQGGARWATTCATRCSTSTSRRSAARRRAARRAPARTAQHYLLSWYYAWGGATDSSAGWAWRIGSSHAHFGYQNPHGRVGAVDGRGSAARVGATA